MIFLKEDHPSLLVTSYKKKEGSSLFNLFDFSVIKDVGGGHSYLLEMMSKPSSSIEEINQRQECTQVLTHQM
jgi:hypothetical protein